jgi:hypothetical protein
MGLLPVSGAIVVEIDFRPTNPGKTAFGVAETIRNQA